ncbi:MAG: hypothetical protein GX496_09865 [Firmicutes bacterium]|nr:hypothetical protein [Bacillota bacterium]
MAVADNVLAILREHRKQQDAERARFTEDWGLVFTASDGSSLNATNFM